MHRKFCAIIVVPDCSPETQPLITFSVLTNALSVGSKFELSQETIQLEEVALRVPLARWVAAGKVRFPGLHVCSG
jgi:hypothetical protein